MVDYAGDSIEPEEYNFGRWVATRDLRLGNVHESTIHPEFWDGTGEYIATEAYKSGYNDVWYLAYMSLVQCLISCSW